MSESKIVPLPGWCLIEPLKDDSETASGWKLPDSSQDVPMKGLVVQRSPLIPFQGDAYVLEEGASSSKEWGLIKTGAIIWFKKYSGQTVKHDGKELKLVEFKDLLAVIE